VTSEAVEDASGLVMFVVCRDAEHSCGRTLLCLWVWMVVTDKESSRGKVQLIIWQIAAKTPVLPGLLSP